MENKILSNLNPNNKVEAIKTILELPLIPKFTAYDNKFYVYKDNHWIFTPKSDLLKFIPDIFKDYIIEYNLFNVMVEYIESLPIKKTYNLYSYTYMFNSKLFKSIKRDYFSKIDVNPTDIYIENEIVDSVLERAALIPLEGLYITYKDKIPASLNATNNFKQFMQFYLASMFHIPVKTFAAIEVNSGFLTFYKQLQTILPNPNIHFGKLGDYLSRPDMYILSLDYKDSENIVLFPDIKIDLTNDDIYAIIAYSLGSLYNFTGDIKWKVIDYTPPIINKRVNLTIAEKLKAANKLYKVEDLGYSEIVNILSILYDELDDETYNTIFTIMYHKYIEEQKEEQWEKDI